MAGYEHFFGLSHPAFSLTADTRFRFDSDSHRSALAQVTYALERREPIVVVTGEIGTGKTLLCRTVVERLERKTFLSVVSDPLLDPDDLLRHVLRDFGVISAGQTPPAGRHELVRALQGFLATLAPLQAHAVVILDEAQHVKTDVLEQIRLISNVQDARGTMLQCVLVGQTDLERLLARPELRQFKQRVTRHVRLDALDRSEVARYIEHRLAVAREPRSQSPGAKALARELASWEPGAREAVFTPEAVDAVAQISRGVPRTVNLVCDRALEAAYARGSHLVDVSIVNAAARALDLEPVAEPEAPILSVWPELAPTAVPAFDASMTTISATRATRYAVAAATILFASVAIWIGARTLRRPDVGTGASQAAPIVEKASGQGPEGSTEPATDAPATAPTTAATTASSIGTAATTPAPPAAGSFEIVVASFHTTARATEVAGQIATLGQPVRQRQANGWQQVLAGPYASAGEARAAQQRLEQAGFTDTKVVTASR